MQVAFKKIKVWHACKRHMDFMGIFDDEMLTNKAFDLWPIEYEYVATIEARTKALPFLNDAYAMTNSMVETWTCPDVNVPDLAKRFQLSLIISLAQQDVHSARRYPLFRSTSMGDILEAEERLFVVTAMGFAEIPHPLVVARIPRNELPLHLGKSRLMDRLIERRLQDEASHSHQ